MYDVVDDFPNSNFSGDTIDSSPSSIPGRKILRTWKRLRVWTLECLLKTHLEGALYLHIIKNRLPSTQIGIDKDDLVTTKRETWRWIKKLKIKKL